jgi:16S rRNA (uracil1498-N3)-methyltransferase
MARLFIPDARFERGQELHLDATRSHRLRDVLRLRLGENLTVLDGRGGEQAAHVIAVESGVVTLKLGEPHRPLAEPPVAVTLVCAFPRGQRGDWIVEKATELGVSTITPLTADRSTMHPGAGRLKRWQRIAIEALEQCGGVTLPAFDTDPPSGALLLVADLDVRMTIAEAIGSVEMFPTAVAIYIGPEGGWTSEERERFAEAGAYFVGLGSRKLRVETAAIVGVAQVLQATSGLASP